MWQTPSERTKEFLIGVLNKSVDHLLVEFADSPTDATEKRIARKITILNYLKASAQ